MGGVILKWKISQLESSGPSFESVSLRYGNCMSHGEPSTVPAHTINKLKLTIQYHSPIYILCISTTFHLLHNHFTQRKQMCWALVFLFVTQTFSRIHEVYVYNRNIVTWTDYEELPEHPRITFTNKISRFRIAWFHIGYRPTYCQIAYLRADPLGRAQTNLPKLLLAKALLLKHARTCFLLLKILLAHTNEQEAKVLSSTFWHVQRAKCFLSETCQNVLESIFAFCSIDVRQSYL